MNCDCHDPIVFGHGCNRPWTSYIPGETFTAIGAAFRQLTTTASQTTLTWQEVARLIRNSTEARETPSMSFKTRETPENQDKPWNSPLNSEN